MASYQAACHGKSPRVCAQHLACTQTHPDSAEAPLQVATATTTITNSSLEADIVACVCCVNIEEVEKRASAKGVAEFTWSCGAPRCRGMPHGSHPIDRSLHAAVAGGISGH